MRISKASALAVVSAAAAIIASLAVPASAGPASAGPASAGPASAAPAAPRLSYVVWPVPHGLIGVACETTRNCLAVGQNDPDSQPQGDSEPLAETWNGRAWYTVNVTSPAGGPVVGLDAAACSRTRGTDCVAVGDYHVATWYAGYNSALADTWNGKALTPVALSDAVIFRLDAVSCVSPKSCLAVGDADSPEGGYDYGIAFSWNGAQWTVLQAPAPVGDARDVGSFTGVSCIAGPLCVATGAYWNGTQQVSAIYLWNGSTWTVGAPATADGVPGLILDSVSCTSPRNCVAVGNGPGSSGTFAEVWNGRTWTVTRPVAWPKGAANAWVSSVSCATPRYCVAAGQIDWNQGDYEYNTGQAAASVWNGRSWTATTVAAPGKGEASEFNGVTCLRTRVCVAVGQSGPYDSTTGPGLSGFWNGRNWHLVNAQ